MSTPSPQPTPPPAPKPATAPAMTQKRQIIIISHSSLFYWWPVWAIGFLMTIISFFGDRLAVVPNGTVAEKRMELKPSEKKYGPEDVRSILILPKGVEEVQTPHIHISSNKNVGVVFCAVLLLVIAITNIPLRGLWSFIVIMLVFFMTIILAIMDWWKYVFEYLGFLDIRINMAGYFVISSILFVLWLLVFLLFDQQLYMIVEPGQLRVRQSIGDAETSYDTTGMTTQKQRSDLFRHWILGLGSGDLIVKTAGSHPVEIPMNNVLFIGRKHQEIEDLLRAREIVTTTGS